MKIFILLTLLVFTSSSWAVTRPEMVKHLKEFILKVESEETFHQIVKFQSRYQFFNEAYAGDLNCFYGGWPSSLVQQGNRKYCSNPSKNSPLYPKNACKSGEMSCQPLLFGNGLCVPSTTAHQKQSTFKYCENAFQKKGGSYDFADKWGDDEKNQFQQMMDLAYKICVSGDLGVQQNKPMCKSLWSKMGQFKIDEKKAAATVSVSSSVTSALVCREENTISKGTKQNIADVLSAAQTLATKNKNKSTDPRLVYQAMKLDYETSPYCDPQHQYDDKGRKQLFFSGLGAEIKRLQPVNAANHIPSLYDIVLDDLYAHFNFSSEDKGQVEKYATSLKSASFSDPNFLQKSFLLQAAMTDIISKKTQSRPALRDKFIARALQTAGVIELDDQDKVVCPFVDEETFVKAYKGYEKLSSKLKKPYLTIVDYTKPSNQRRMYVLDMKSGQVLGNTWVSQGMGEDRTQEGGSEGDGRKPIVSNRDGSLLSSAGFIMTAQASTGKEYGPNIILKGMEAQNSNIQKRAIIIHGFRTQPLPKIYDDPEFDLFDKWDAAKTIEEKADMVWEFRKMNVKPFIDGTYGCLGVARHPTIDRETGKTVDQLDYLRSKINDGSLIYSHASPDQTSDYY